MAACPQSCYGQGMVRKQGTDQLHVDLPAELKQAARAAAAAADMTLGQWVRAVIRDRLAELSQPDQAGGDEPA